MLEHLDRGEVQRFLEECRRVLRPGGVLRVVVPDLRLILEEYLRSGDADRFMEATRLGTRRPANVRDKMNVLVGNGSAHRWMYDGPSLCRLLTSAGFRDPQEVGVGITTISNPEALDLRERAGESVYVEARR